MKAIIMTIALCFIFQIGFAQLEPYKDFDTSDEVTFISTIKVSENMIPYYLEGLQKTWVPAAKYQKEKGYIKDFKVFVSDLAESGDFNVITWLTFENDVAARGSEKIYDDITKYMNSLMAKEERDKVVTQSYPNMRDIVGQYRIRSVTFK